MINSVFWVITLRVVFIGRRFRTPVCSIFWVDEGGYYIINCVTNGQLVLEWWNVGDYDVRQTRGQDRGHRIYTKFCRGNHLGSDYFFKLTN